GPADEVFAKPQHPYTQALLSADLPADPTAVRHRHVLKGEIPSPVSLPNGCLFAGRCPLVIDACRSSRPAHRTVSPRHSAACVRIDDKTNLLPASGKGTHAELQEASQ